ncbi:MAG: hypothetical protein EKK63_00280 [Acinetobacter sp.]|uniref:hypothetical protein n=1 Tax=Acinetobacter sp. TaxID=472 RepID=UPI000FAF5A73|nr:hypothetical protein [Acinetobacter sp.]RUP42609.1 MAG: hypothetical protein EKK63_00280 [Acinetobacter sp.]
MSLINSSYFIGERDIPNTDNAATAAALDTFIRTYEKQYLKKALGYELFKVFTTGLQADTPAQRYLDLLFGKEFTGHDGKLKKWEGLVSVTEAQPTISVELANSDVIFTVGVTTGAPAHGATEYVNTDLAGKSYRVWQRGNNYLEALKEDESNIDTADIRINPDGGFSWLNGTQFSQGDKYVLTLLTAPLDASGADIVPVPVSPVADFTYYHWQGFNVTQTTGLGESLPKMQNGENASPVDKMVKAWNDMVEKTMLLQEFLQVNATTYPEYSTCDTDVELLTYKNRYQ